MTFTVLAPWLAWSTIALAAGLAAAVFVIRRRPPRVVVASLVVWQRVLDDRRERSLWERIRWVVSLLATVAIAAMLAMALARPVWSLGGDRGRVLVVLDSSWTMRARLPTGESRWDRARASARAIVAAFAAREVAVATTAEGIVQRPTTDRALLTAVLERLEPTGADDGAWPRVAGTSETHLVTDGAVLRPAARDAVIHSVFAAVPNVAVTAFEVDETAGSSGGAEAFFAVANYADAAQPVDVTVTRGDQVIFSRTIPIDAFAVHRESIALPRAGNARFHIRARARANALDVDDEAARWMWTAEPLDVVVVGEASAVPPLLAVDRTLRVTSVSAAQHTTATADVWVFDGWLPQAPPSRPALVLDPPSAPWFGERAAEERAPRWRRARTHPILEGVDGAFVQIGTAHTIRRPTLEPLAASPSGTPLVSVEDSSTARYVVLAFSTTDSNVAATPWFPVLVGNAIDWLGRPERGQERPLGLIVLPATTTRLVAPSGQPVPLTRLADRVTADLRLPGLYLVESAGAPRVVTVTLDDPARSNLMTSAVATPAAPAIGGVRGAWPGWFVLGGAVLVLILLEWFTWQRRLTV